MVDGFTAGMLTIDSGDDPGEHRQMTEIIAHRGASHDCLENTLDAFATALAQGADGIELDVHPTTDGQVVVHHDPQVRDQTGRGFSITGTSAAVLRTIKLRNGESVPLLDEVLDLVGNRAVVYIEVKGVNAEQAVVDCAARHPSCRVAVHSFDHRIPQRVRTLAPHIPVGLLSTSYPVDMKGFIGGVAPNALWQHAAMIDAALVTAAAQLGTRVIAWTVNDARDARTLVGDGVSAICTDKPGEMRKLLLNGRNREG